MDIKKSNVSIVAKSSKGISLSFYCKNCGCEIYSDEVSQLEMQDTLRYFQSQYAYCFQCGEKLIYG